MKITDKLLRENAARARELWLETLPQQEEVPEPACSEEFLAKMDLLQKKQRRAEAVRRSLRTVRRVAAVVLIFLTVTFAGLMTVEAFRARVVKIFTRTFKDRTEFRYSGDNENAVLPEITFGYLPEGMEKKLDDTDNCIFRHILWEDSAGNYLDFRANAVSKNSTGVHVVDTENAEVSTAVIDGRVTTAVSKNGTIIIVWTDEKTYYMIDSNLSISDVEAFISGIMIK